MSRFNKILVVFLAGFLLLISTACSGTDSSQVLQKSALTGSSVQKLTEDPNYDYYDANQPKQGGMNKYNDDSRLENSDVQKKADKLVNKARTNLQQKNDNREHAGKVSKAGKRLDNTVEDLANKTDRFKRDVAQDAQKKLDITKNNLEKASSKVTRVAEDVSDKFQGKMNDTAKTTRRTAEDTLDKVGDPS